MVVDNGDPKLATNVAEVQARGGRIISIGSVGSIRAGAAQPGRTMGPDSRPPFRCRYWPGLSRWLWGVTSTNPATSPNQ